MFCRAHSSRSCLEWCKDCCLEPGNPFVCCDKLPARELPQLVIPRIFRLWWPFIVITICYTLTYVACTATSLEVFLTTTIIYQLRVCTFILNHYERYNVLLLSFTSHDLAWRLVRVLSSEIERGWTKSVRVLLSDGPLLISARYCLRMDINYCCCHNFTCWMIATSIYNNSNKDHKSTWWFSNGALRNSDMRWQQLGKSVARQWFDGSMSNMIGSKIVVAQLIDKLPMERSQLATSFEPDEDQATS